MSNVVRWEDGLRPAGKVFMQPVEGDNMEPTLKRGGFVLLRTVSDFIGEGIYLFEEGQHISLRRAAAMVGADKIELSSDNAIYSRLCVPLEWFRQHVTAKAVFSCNVLDRALIPDAPRF